MMMYPKLIESCQKAITNEWCLGCQSLEDPNFKGKINCEHSKMPEIKKNTNYKQESLFNE